MSNARNFDPLADATPADAHALEEADMDTQPLVLGIDTATEVRSFAIIQGTKLLAAQSNEPGAAQSSTVLGDLDRVLWSASVTTKQIDLFAVAVGPGSFTGLRAGLATVKALANTLRKDAVGIQTLHAVARAAMPAKRVLALMPAGRGEVFAQFLEGNSDNVVVERSQPMHISPGELIEMAKSIRTPLKWAGINAAKYLDLIEEAARAEDIAIFNGVKTEGAQDGRVWTLSLQEHGLARVIATLAWERLRQGIPLEDSLKAVYVRPADARVGGM